MFVQELEEVSVELQDQARLISCSYISQCLGDVEGSKLLSIGKFAVQAEHWHQEDP